MLSLQLKFLVIGVGLLFVISTSCARGTDWTKQKNRFTGVNGGAGCAACTVVVALIEQLTEINNTTVVHTLQQLCDYLPQKFSPSCHTAAQYLGPILVVFLVHNHGPDAACHAMRFCWTDPGQPTCRTIVPPVNNLKDAPFRHFTQTLLFESEVVKAKQRVAHLYHHEKTVSTINFCNYPGIRELCVWLKRVFSEHKPYTDMDGDNYSTAMGLRGSSWRGKDCLDISSSVYPGTRPMFQDKDYDSNCNGIYGLNNKTQKTYEEELCGSSQPRGVAVLGDSLSAHFHLPPQWLDPTQISKKAFKDLMFIIENEIDWPMLSTITGHGTNKWPEVISGPIDSFYLRMKERNRCNHRDYQNIAVNGEDSFDMTELVQTLARNGKKDYPIVAFYALMGNDVCNGSPDTLAHMTTPEQMYNNTMKTLQHLHQNLPNNSHVILVGLADGRILFENMGNRIHPVAAHWGEMTYGKFYDYLNCLQISPCRGWMTTNETLRNLTTKRAFELTDVLRTIHKQHRGSFHNFNLYFVENPINEVIQEWEASGGEPWQLIEPSDGFHTNQNGQALTSKVLWRKIEKLYPDILGPVNPHNDAIEKLFGDQGGY